jgi:hypothetical protein
MADYTRAAATRKLATQVAGEMEAMIKQAVDTAYENDLKRLLRHAESILTARQKRYGAFEDRLQVRWNEALSWYELALYKTHELGFDFNHSLRPIAAKRQDFKFEALIRLHANAALIGGEILQLLQGGYASGAHARWRSLHETAVVAMFIEGEENDTAERFLLHYFVKAYEDAQQYQQYCRKLRQRRFTKKEMSEMERRYEQVIAKYGKDFAGSFGWAKAALGNRNPARKGGVTFSELERATAVEFWTPYYRLASHAVHSTATTVTFNIATSMRGNTAPMLAGPSNSGLADPGHGALLSMNNVSAALMGHSRRLIEYPGELVTGFVAELEECLQPALRMQVRVRILSYLAEKAGESFQSAQTDLDDEEEAIQEAIRQSAKEWKSRE